MQCDTFGWKSPARDWGKALCQDRPGAHVMNSECFLTRSCVPRRKSFSTVVGKQGHAMHQGPGVFGKGHARERRCAQCQSFLLPRRITCYSDSQSCQHQEPPTQSPKFLPHCLQALRHLCVDAAVQSSSKTDFLSGGTASVQVDKRVCYSSSNLV